MLVSLHPPRRITTINELLCLEPWVTGVKTGHTFDAGYVLVGSGRRKGVELISVVIGAPTDEARDGETLELLEYGFAQYRPRGADPRGPGARRAVDPLLRWRAAAARRAHASLRRPSRPALERRRSARREVEGPIGRGAVLGRATVLVDGRPAGSTRAAGRPLDPRGERFDRARTSSEHTILTAVGAVRDTHGRGSAVPPAVPLNDQGALT